MVDALILSLARQKIPRSVMLHPARCPYRVKYLQPPRHLCRNHCHCAWPGQLSTRDVLDRTYLNTLIEVSESAGRPLHTCSWTGYISQHGATHLPPWTHEFHAGLAKWWERNFGYGLVEVVRNSHGVDRTSSEGGMKSSLLLNPCALVLRIGRPERWSGVRQAAQLPLEYGLKGIPSVFTSNCKT